MSWSLLNGLKYASERNKSVFIDLVRYEVESEKVCYRGKHAVSKRIAVCPIVPVALRDFFVRFQEPFAIQSRSRFPDPI
jgi:hypothetical protein